MKYNRISKNEDSVLGGRKVIKVDEEGNMPTEMKTLYICLNPKSHLTLILDIIIWGKN